MREDLNRALVLRAVEAMEKYTGAERGYRRAHARGIVCRGSFRATPAARELSTAEHLQGSEVPAHVRLSNAAGNPAAPDHTFARGGVLGLAVRYELPSGMVASSAAASLPSFVAATPADFIRFTTALKPALFGLPNPLRLLFYLLSRPSAFTAVKAIVTRRATPSFAHARFNGIHTYRLVDANGARRPFRYRWEPRARPRALTCAERRRLPPQYLLDELRTRLATAPVQFDLVFQFPAPADPLDDATRAWPETRPTVLAGTLTVERVEQDQRALETLVFDPAGVVPGIELSSDPLLGFRSDVYRESHVRRVSESRDHTAPRDMGQ